MVASRMNAHVTARRNLLRGAGGLAAAAVLTPKLALAQRFTETTISQAAQDARREAGRLARRADDLLRATVADGPERNAVAVRRFRAEQVSLTRDLATLFNTKVSEDDWLLIVPTRELDLVLAMQPLVIRIAPTAAEVEAAVKAPLPQIEPLAGDRAEDVLLTIVLAAFGLERQVGVFEILRDDPYLGLLLSDTAAAIKARRYGLVAFDLDRLMRAFTLPHNVAAIADNYGEEAKRRLYESLIVRFVPFIGWALFDTALLATIYYNRDTTAPILR